jgi:glycosyltransferase involved in cell wall biosynthesis/mitochondrial fission protein ELM1
MSTSNHLSPLSATGNTTYLCVWFFHDRRPGHLKQLQGLAARLDALAGINAVWLDIHEQRTGLRHFLTTPSFMRTLPKPDMIIGAGHQTHISVLVAACHFKAFRVLVMKPSLPLRWFDAVICPEHDNAPAAAHIFNTFGPLNLVTPPEQPKPAMMRTEHLILIGGPSKHYHFDAGSLLTQIQQLCHETPSIVWRLSNSPRTPEGFTTALTALQLPNLRLHDYRQGLPDPLDILLTRTHIAWVTPDSMAMIFEALTAGARVGLFNAPVNTNRQQSRIVKQVQTLISSLKVIAFPQRAMLMEPRPAPQSPLWETDRAARWLLQRYAKSTGHAVTPIRTTPIVTSMHSQLRLLQILPAMVSGGVERGTLDLSRYLVSQGHEVWVCSSGGPLVAELTQAGVTHIQLPVNSKNPLRMWLNSRRLIQLQNRYRFDLIHVRSRAPAWSVFWAKKQMNTPIISTFHGQYGHHNRLKRFYNRVMLQSDVCIAVSEFIEQHIRTTYPSPPCKLSLIRRGIDLTQFSERPDLNVKAQALREKWGINKDQIIIILPGRLTRLKGHQVFLEALSILQNQTATARLRCLIVGDEPGKDSYRKELEAFIETRQLSELVQLTGICYDMPALYSLAHIVVSASTKPEAFGRTACEAQAMGCLVVATRHGGSLETIAPQQRPFMCEQNNSASMADAIACALQMLEAHNENALLAIKQEARRYIEENFSLIRMCRETEQLYLEYTEQAQTQNPLNNETTYSSRAHHEPDKR